MAGTENKSTITLKGSSETVAEFFHYGINSILYQRGVFPPETFTRLQKYGLTLLVSTNEELKKYLSVILDRIKQWLVDRTIQKLVLVISSLDSGDVLEKWNFDVEYEGDATKETGSKAMSEIHKEICAIIRQITASITFLPLLDCALLRHPITPLQSLRLVCRTEESGTIEGPMGHAAITDYITTLDQWTNLKSTLELPMIISLFVLQKFNCQLFNRSYESYCQNQQSAQKDQVRLAPNIRYASMSLPGLTWPLKLGWFYWYCHLLKDIECLEKSSRERECSSSHQRIFYADSL